MCSRRSSQRIGALLAKALPQKYFLLESGTVKYPALRGSRGDDIIQYISETTRFIVLWQSWADIGYWSSLIGHSHKINSACRVSDTPASLCPLLAASIFLFPSLAFAFWALFSLLFDVLARWRKITFCSCRSWKGIGPETSPGIKASCSVFPPLHSTGESSSSSSSSSSFYLLPFFLQLDIFQLLLREWKLLLDYCGWKCKCVKLYFLFLLLTWFWVWSFLDFWITNPLNLFLFLPVLFLILPHLSFLL